MQIVGHTDDVGDIDINQTLSEERASAIKSALVAQGIEASRITTVGFGPTKPVARTTEPLTGGNATAESSLWWLPEYWAFLVRVWR